MTAIIKDFMYAGIGGALAYYIVNYVMTLLITGTTSTDNFVKGLLPIIVAIGAVWLVLSVAFRSAPG